MSPQRYTPTAVHGFIHPYGWGWSSFRNISLRTKRRTGVLWMSAPVTVTIVGAPVACAEGVRDTWRDVAGWAARQLRQHFGDGIHVKYFDLFEENCPVLPPGVQLPLVLVDEQVLSSGGKISVPMIRKRLEEVGVLVLNR